MSSTWSDDDGAPERSLRVGRVAAPLRSQALEVVRDTPRSSMSSRSKSRRPGS